MKNFIAPKGFVVGEDIQILDPKSGTYVAFKIRQLHSELNKNVNIYLTALCSPHDAWAPYASLFAHVRIIVDPHEDAPFDPTSDKPISDDPTDHRAVWDDFDELENALNTGNYFIG